MEFVTKKVQEWSEHLLEPTNIRTPQPHATFTAFGHGYMHNWIVKNLGRTFTKFLQESCQNLGKIIARFVARMPNNHARSMQDPCKIVAKSLRELSKTLARISKDLAKFCENYPKF